MSGCWSSCACSYHISRGEAVAGCWFMLSKPALEVHAFNTTHLLGPDSQNPVILTISTAPMLEHCTLCNYSPAPHLVSSPLPTCPHTSGLRTASTSWHAWRSFCAAAPASARVRSRQPQQQLLPPPSPQCRHPLAAGAPRAHMMALLQCRRVASRAATAPAVVPAPRRLMSSLPTSRGWTLGRLSTRRRWWRLRRRPTLRMSVSGRRGAAAWGDGCPSCWVLWFIREVAVEVRGHAGARKFRWFGMVSSGLTDRQVPASWFAAEVATCGNAQIGESVIGRCQVGDVM